MLTTTLLNDLYQHMEWADSEVWAVVPTPDGSSPDEELLARLVHIHTVQAGFESVWRGDKIVWREPKDFETLAEVRDFVRPFYARMPATLEALTDAQLADPMPLPWAKYFARTLGHAPAVSTRGDTLLQVALHTQYHRGQVNTRLRQLGVTPPLVDYIAWIWRNRPAPAWAP